MIHHSYRKLYGYPDIFEDTKESNFVMSVNIDSLRRPTKSLSYTSIGLNATSSLKKSTYSLVSQRRFRLVDIVYLLFKHSEKDE